MQLHLFVSELLTVISTRSFGFILPILFPFTHFLLVLKQTLDVMSFHL